MGKSVEGLTGMKTLIRKRSLSTCVSMPLKSSTPLLFFSLQKKGIKTYTPRWDPLKKVQRTLRSRNPEWAEFLFPNHVGEKELKAKQFEQTIKDFNAQNVFEFDVTPSVERKRGEPYIPFLRAEIRRVKGRKCLMELRKHGVVPALLRGGPYQDLLITLQEKRISYLNGRKDLVGYPQFMIIGGKTYLVEATSIQLEPVSMVPMHVMFKRVSFEPVTDTATIEENYKRPIIEAREAEIEELRKSVETRLQASLQNRYKYAAAYEEGRQERLSRPEYA